MAYKDILIFDILDVRIVNSAALLLEIKKNK